MSIMNWQSDRHDVKPIYKQIASHLENQIACGEFPSGSKLPSERELAKQLQVNRSTIVAAYEELQALGLVERKHGSGTKVSSDIWGISYKRIPNWRHIVEQGSLLPNVPLFRQIQQETHHSQIIDLASGELSPDLFPSHFFQELMATKPFTWHLGYEKPQGNITLRETICTHVKKKKQIEVTPASILITSGAQQALHLVIQCLLRAGDAIAIEDPSYFYSLPLFQSAGLRIFLLPTDQDGINPDDVERLYKKHRIKMIFVNPHFQNPTGTLLSMERKLHLLEISAKYGIPIVEDDPYSLTSFSGEPVMTLKSMDQHGTVLYVSSLTKLAASGLRIGWVIGPQTVIERLADAKQQVDFGHSIFPEWISHHFLSSEIFDTHIDDMRAKLLQKSNIIMQALQNKLTDKVSYLVPQGGIHLWCKLNQPVNESALIKEAILHGVVFVPGSVLGSKEGYVRFTFGRAEDDLIEEGIDRFAQALSIAIE